VKAFILTMIALMSIEALGKLCWLALGKIPERQPGVVMLDVLICFVLIVWAVALIR
jgi:hypothetical protein